MEEDQRPQYLSIHNWSKYQIIQHGRPGQWCRLYCALLDDYEFMSWSASEQLTYLLCLMLRTRLGHNLPSDLQMITRMMGKSRPGEAPNTVQALSKLITKSRLVLTNQKTDEENTGTVPAQSRVEKSREENTPHKPPKGQAAYSEGFLIFWKDYPAKVGKDAAWRKWKELATTPEIRKQIISSVKDHAEHDQRWLDGKICNPATFLHQGRWKDELPKNGNGLKDYTDEEVERLIERSQRLHTSH